MPMLTQYRFGAYHRRQMLHPQHAGAGFGAKSAHLPSVTAGSDCVAVAARRTRARSIRHTVDWAAQDNCFAIFATRAAHIAT
jgi:hypothetical protein